MSVRPIPARDLESIFGAMPADAGRSAVPSGSSHVSLSRPKAAAAIASRDYSREWWLEPGFKRHPQVLYPDQIGKRADLGEIPPGIAIASAYGGYIGIAVMMLVAALIGAMLAIGGVL
jgi:hypothetical protein